MWKAQHSSTSSKKWREFGWKNLIHFFITPQIKSKSSKSQQQCWRQCGQMDANHSHIFWTCPKIQIFWSNICLILKKVLRYDLPIDVKVLYLGIIRDDVIDKKDWYLCKILFIACKKAIARNWYKPEPSTVEGYNQGDFYNGEDDFFSMT